ncbi:Uncharacterized protein CK203_092326 [Vitis vinifera]|uniref:Leucine-rich repeat extensin-like protein 4 n=1 Tax=Vitis vinifera TaxID=29760 RepID=A0A438DYA5_VITVI|nr:Uncharacterized protein CK203_092326 [Vitis vinifera]
MSGLFSISTKFSTLCICLIFLAINTEGESSNREILELTIGGGSGDRGGGGGGNRTQKEKLWNPFCSLPPHFALQFPPLPYGIPTPPPPVGPEVLVFDDQRRAVVYPVIQKFKAIITSVPLGIAKSWQGLDICSCKGFYFDNPPDNKTAIALASIDFNGFQLGAPTLDGFINQLPDIALFHANSNNFAGTNPPDIAKLPYLYELDITNNRFMGPIPRSINKTLSTLTEVLFLNNMLTGCLPLEIGFLKEARVFDVGNNRLTGPIPFSLGCLEKVEELNFAGKLFYGMVPEVLCQLPNLLNLSLYDNYFMQVGLACRSLIWKGLLDIRKNCIPDLPFQRSVAECADLFQYPRFCPYMNSHSLQASASWFSGFFDSLKWLLSLVILFSCKPL